MAAYDKKLTNLDQLKLLAQKVKSENDALEAKIGAIKVPTKVSDLNNDSEFQTKTEVASAIATAVASAEHLKYEIVESTSSVQTPDTHTIYLVARTDNTNGNKYDEYMYVGGAFEKVGDWGVDLSGYVQKETGKSLVSDTLISKLTGISEGATKVEKSNTNGNIKVDGSEVVVYTLPDTVLHSSMVASDSEVTSMLNDVFTDGE